jgi:hypothetical protein
MSGGVASEVEQPASHNPQTPIAESPFTLEQLADMHREMNRLLTDFPDGNIPPEIVAEWEAKAEAARQGAVWDESDLIASIDADKGAPKRRRQAADKPPADMVPDTQDDAQIIKLNRADSKLAAQLARLYLLIGAGVTLVNMADGTIILMGAETRAQELVLLANHHPALKKALRSLTESNDYLIFAMGHGGMILAILQNHGVVPQNIGTSIVRLFQRRSSDHVQAE